MILTGKAKKDFLSWLYSEYDFTEKTFNELYPENLKEWFIIKWFDSVGIHIKIIPKPSIVYCGYYATVVYNKNGIQKEVNVLNNEYNDSYFNSRIESTKQAIKYANRHYNFNNNQD